MADNLSSFSKIPLTDQVPAGSQAIVSSVNQSLLALSTRPDNIQVKQISFAVPDPWIVATQKNAWVTSFSYMKHYDGSVEIQGSATGGAYGTVAFSLPAGMRPKSNMTVPSVGGAVFAYAIIQTNGDVIPSGGAGVFNLNIRFQPTDNRPFPLSCFPINIKTKFKSPPMAVVAISNVRNANDIRPSCAAQTPSWRFINGPTGPTVQILNITGLEYGCKQKIKIAILGG